MQDIISIFALVWEMFKSISHFNYNIKDYIHKIILFSIFSSFGISLIPFNRETLDCNDFRLYSYRNVCVISTKSVLFWEKSEISFKNIKTTFDSHRKHMILSYSSAFNLIRELLTSFYGKIPIEYPKSFKLIEDNINIILFNLIKLNSDILCNPKDKVRDVLEMMKKINRSLFNKDDNEEYFYPLSNVSEFNLASLIINLNSYVFSDDLNNESLSIIISFFKLLFAIIYERYQEFHKKNCEIEEERLFINSLLSNYYLLFGMLKHQCSFDFILCIPFHLQVKLNFDEKENSYQNILNRKVSIYKIFKLLQTNVSKSALLKITWIKLIYYCFYM